MSNKEACESCQATDYYYYRVAVDDKGNRWTECSECSKRPQPGLSPDVYFDGKKGAFQTDPNLCDRKGTPISFSSRREKAAVMRHLGVREAGDAVRGSRNFDKTASRQWDRILNK